MWGRYPVQRWRWRKQNSGGCESKGSGAARLMGRLAKKAEFAASELVARLRQRRRCCAHRPSRSSPRPQRRCRDEDRASLAGSVPPTPSIGIVVILSLALWVRGDAKASLNIFGPGFLVEQQPRSSPMRGAENPRGRARASLPGPLHNYPGLPADAAAKLLIPFVRRDGRVV